MWIVIGNFGDGWEVVSCAVFNENHQAVEWLLENGESADEYEPDNIPKYAIVNLTQHVMKITGQPRLERL